MCRMGIRPMRGKIPSGRSECVNMLGGHESDLLPEAPPLWFALAAGVCGWTWRCKDTHTYHTEPRNKLAVG